MAYQAGLLRLKGRLGDLSFYFHKQHGFLVRQKGGPQGQQVSGAPNFERTRENNTEFSDAVRIGKLIRQAVRQALGLKGDADVSQRLTGLLVTMGKSDHSTKRGMRSAAAVFHEPASRELLRSFAFYQDSKLSTVYSGTIRFDGVGGTLVFDPGTNGIHTPARDFFRAPPNATHVRIKSALVTFDFGRNSYQSSTAELLIHGLDEVIGTHAFVFGEESQDPLGVRTGIVAIEFMQEQNQELYLLGEGCSMGIVS